MTEEDKKLKEQMKKAEDIKPVDVLESGEDPESVDNREASEYEDKLNELHDNLDSIKSTGRELHQTLHHRADEAETMQGEKRFRRLAGSAYNLFGRLRDGDREVLRGGINTDE